MIGIWDSIYMSPSPFEKKQKSKQFSAHLPLLWNLDVIVVPACSFLSRVNLLFRVGASDAWVNWSSLLSPSGAVLWLLKDLRTFQFCSFSYVRFLVGNHARQCHGFYSTFAEILMPVILLKTGYQRKVCPRPVSGNSILVEFHYMLVIQTVCPQTYAILMKGQLPNDVWLALGVSQNIHSLHILVFLCIP